MNGQHDLRSLQVFIEGEFKASEQMKARMHQENQFAIAGLTAELTAVRVQTTATNGRVGKLEIWMAVVKFAVFTIGGGLVFIVARLAGLVK